MAIGLLVIVVGVLFLLKNLGVIAGNFWDVLWPLVIVVAGISMFFGRKKHHRD